MITSPASTCTAVVVGAGPVGLVAASELARRGVTVRIVDKLAEPTTESRAIAIHARSLDMLDRMGVVDELIATGVKSTGMNMVANGKKLFTVDLTGVDSAEPYSLITAQTETERVLTDHLNALGVEIERGTEVVDLSQDGGAVHLTVQAADGSTERIDASWVIGTDGARSSVRHLVGSRLLGTFKGERFILGDVECEHPLGNSSMYTFFHADGPVVTLPMRGGRVRFLAQIHDADGAPLNLHPTQQALQDIIDARVGGITITDSHWLSCFEIKHGQVAQYRFGRVFLAGDAAHIHSPAGGQGMNTGMQDAFNLAWKLAAVCAGEGGETLLESYHAERHPIAEEVISFTGLLTKVGTLQGAARVVRNTIAGVAGKSSFVTGKIADNVAEVTIAYPDSPAIIKGGPRGAKIHAGQHIPHISDVEVQNQLGTADPGHVIVTVAAGQPAPAAGPAGRHQVLITSDPTPVSGYDTVVLDSTGVVAKRFGLKDGGRVVIRPDGYIGAVVALDDGAGVADYFAAIAH